MTRSWHINARASARCPKLLRPHLTKLAPMFPMSQSIYSIEMFPVLLVENVSPAPVPWVPMFPNHNVAQLPHSPGHKKLPRYIRQSTCVLIFMLPSSYVLQNCYQMSLYSPQKFLSPIIPQFYLQMSNKGYECCMTHLNPGEHWILWILQDRVQQPLTISSKWHFRFIEG